MTYTADSKYIYKNRAKFLYKNYNNANITKNIKQLKKALINYQTRDETFSHSQQLIIVKGGSTSPL